MKSNTLHEWNVPPKEAISIQRWLKDQIRLGPLRTPVRKIAGADISVYRQSGEAYAGVVVFSYPDLTLLEQRGKKVEVTFPYIPGLLSFREIPVLLKVFEGLKHEPDLILVDGQGIAHPRGFGIASHLGVLFQKPTIGCAKSWLYGDFHPPSSEAGSRSYLYSKVGEVIGAVLRTRTGVRPLFVSCGHKIDLPGALDYTLSACCGYRQPEPTRQAHLFVKGLKAAL